MGFVLTSLKRWTWYPDSVICEASNIVGVRYVLRAVVEESSVVREWKGTASCWTHCIGF